MSERDQVPAPGRSPPQERSHNDDMDSLLELDSGRDGSSLFLAGPTGTAAGSAGSRQPTTSAKRRWIEVDRGSDEENPEPPAKRRDPQQELFDSCIPYHYHSLEEHRIDDERRQKRLKRLLQAIKRGFDERDKAQSDAQAAAAPPAPPVASAAAATITSSVMTSVAAAPTLPSVAGLTSSSASPAASVSGGIAVQSSMPQPLTMVAVSTGTGPAPVSLGSMTAAAVAPAPMTMLPLMPANTGSPSTNLFSVGASVASSRRTAAARRRARR